MIYVHYLFDWNGMGTEVARASEGLVGADKPRTTRCGRLVCFPPNVSSNGNQEDGVVAPTCSKLCHCCVVLATLYLTK